ncbi:MAG: hybrid sensor histidine kinase/response regulator [Betaproteobacteria bacterium]
MRGDAGRLQQVFNNVIGNAIKFSAEGGRVEISARREGRALRIVVRDHGEGIEPAFLPRIFESFRQADATITRRHRGLGLGIAQHLVERHRGTIAVHSAGPGQGTTFTVTLWMDDEPEASNDAPTRAVAAAAPADGESQEPRPLEGRSLLVVDDNADTLPMMAELFRLSGATVETAGSAKEALARFDAGLRIDALISDIGMPEVDGYELLHALTRRYPERRAAFVAVAATGYAREEDRLRSLAAGYDLHAAKPLDFTSLTGSIGALIAQRRTQRVKGS